MGLSFLLFGSVGIVRADVLHNSPVVGIGEKESRFGNSLTGERGPQFVVRFSQDDGVRDPRAQGRIGAALRRGFQTRETELTLARMLGDLDR